MVMDRHRGRPGPGNRPVRDGGRRPGLRRPWGCDPRQVSTPVLFVHRAQDRIVPSSHATWLVQRCRTAELWLAQTTDTSGSSTPAPWPWTGSASTPVTAEPEPAPLGRSTGESPLVPIPFPPPFPYGARRPSP